MPVTGIDGIQLAVEAILAGEMAGTVAWDPLLAGRHGPVDRLPAKTGVFDPATEPKEHREFYGTGVIITAENAQEFYDEQHQGRAAARLERHLGPRHRARSSTTESLSPEAARRLRPAASASPAMAGHATRSRAIGKAEGTIGDGWRGSAGRLDGPARSGAARRPRRSAWLRWRRCSCWSRSAPSSPRSTRTS